MKKVVLIVSDICPVPATEGSARAILRLLTLLRSEGYYLIYVLQRPSLEAGRMQALRERVEEVVDIIAYRLPAASNAGHRFSAAYALAHRTGRRILKPFLPDRVQDWLARKALYPTRTCWTKTTEIVRQIIAAESPVAVIAEYHYMTPVFAACGPTILKLVDTHDVHSRLMEEVIGRGVNESHRACAPAMERAALLRADVIIAIQAKEAALLRQLVPERKTIVFGYAPPEIISCHPAPVNGENVLLVAGSNGLNVHGLKWFCASVWPRVLAARPEAQLRVVGAISSALPESTPNAQAWGVVESIREHYAQAAVVINPTRHGTGLKIKTVEALAFGKALVTTPVGFEGLEFEGQPAPCMVCGTPEEFAVALVQILSDRETRQQWELRAIDFAEKFLTPEAVSRELRETLSQHCRDMGEAVLV